MQNPAVLIGGGVEAMQLKMMCWNVAGGQEVMGLEMTE